MYANKRNEEVISMKICNIGKTNSTIFPFENTKADKRIQLISIASLHDTNVQTILNDQVIIINCRINYHL